MARAINFSASACRCCAGRQKYFRMRLSGKFGSLLTSPFHEERLCALLLLAQKFTRGNFRDQKAIYDLYLKNTRYINNWDLVDLSAYLIVGAYLADKDRRPLYTLAQSPSLWERRIAIIATFHFIKNHHYTDTLAIAGLAACGQGRPDPQSDRLDAARSRQAGFGRRERIP